MLSINAEALLIRNVQQGIKSTKSAKVFDQG